MSERRHRSVVSSDDLRTQLWALQAQLEAGRNRWSLELAQIPPSARDRAEALVAWVVLRERDRRELDRALQAVGFGDLESHPGHLRPHLRAWMHWLDPHTSGPPTGFDAQPPVRARSSVPPRLVVRWGPEASTSPAELLDRGAEALVLRGPSEDAQGGLQQVQAAARDLGISAPVWLELEGAQVRIGDLVRKGSGRPKKIRLGPGDRLLLTSDDAPGRPPQLDDDGVMLSPASAPCQPPEALDGLKAQDGFTYEDGMARGVVLERLQEGALLEVRQVRAGPSIRLQPGGRLVFDGAGPGLPPVSAADGRLLEEMGEKVSGVVARVRGPEDVERVGQALGPGQTLWARCDGLTALRQLPRTLLALLRMPAAGVILDPHRPLGLGAARNARVAFESAALVHAAGFPCLEVAAEAEAFRPWPDAWVHGTWLSEPDRDRVRQESARLERSRLRDRRTAFRLWQEPEDVTG